MRDIRFLLNTHYAESRALIIGINDYQKTPPLGYAVSDALGVKQVLIERLGFPEQNIVTLLDGNATRTSIFKSFLGFTADTIGLDDRILVFFAGHGMTRTGLRGDVGYLVPVDANVDDPATLIRWDDLTRNADLIRAKHILFVMDACYGGLALTRAPHGGNARFLKDMLLRNSRQVLTAGKADEVVADAGGPLPNHSVFTGHLLEGLSGKAADSQGIITASSLMSYVYSKVSTDKNSNQTPHYGHIDGDGDFILAAPQLEELERREDLDLDRLMVVPYADEFLDQPRDSLKSKIARIKELLSRPENSIQLHDFVIDEVKRFHSLSGLDHFGVGGPYSDDELLSRIGKYEHCARDISVLLAALAYWASDPQRHVLRKAFSRVADHLESLGGLKVWLDLRWYPLILQMYSAGIAAVEARRYSSLAEILLTQIEMSDGIRSNILLVEGASRAILEFTRADLFKKLPGHQQQYVPMSEYLFKILQPQLDDALFLGKTYESAFDEFEVLFALVCADIRKQNGRDAWGPIGRFGWKHSKNDNAPLTRVITQAKSDGKNWLPLQAGLFGGEISRFLEAAEQYEKGVAGLNWW